MKNKLAFLTLMCASFLTGVSSASNPTSEERRASVSTTRTDNIINIKITPDAGYKWNGLYPATLKFSVCSDLECVMYTEKIVAP